MFSIKCIYSGRSRRSEGRKQGPRKHTHTRGGAGGEREGRRGAEGGGGGGGEILEETRTRKHIGRSIIPPFHPFPSSTLALPLLTCCLCGLLAEGKVQRHTTRILVGTMGKRNINTPYAFTCPPFLLPSLLPSQTSTHTQTSTRTHTSSRFV